MFSLTYSYLYYTNLDVYTLYIYSYCLNVILLYPVQTITVILTMAL